MTTKNSKLAQTKNTPTTLPSDPAEELERAFDFETLNAEKFEQEIALYLCARYRVSSSLRSEMVEASQQAYGRRVLTVEQFSLCVAGFPIYLGCQFIPKVGQDASVSRLFRNFGDRKFVVAYEDFQAAHRDILGERPVGLVFNWPYLGGCKGLVIHNAQPRWDLPGVRLTWHPPGQDVQLTVEPLSVLLDGLAFS